MNLLTVEIDGAVHQKESAIHDLPVFYGSGGLQPGINPTSNKSILRAAGDQQIDATKHLLVEASTNLIHAIESATLAPRVPQPSKVASPDKTLRETLYVEGFHAMERNHD